MDLAPLLTAIGGGITLTGALVLALVRYLTSDTGYRGLIEEQRAELQKQRRETEALREALRANQRREAWLMAEVVRLGGRMPPPYLWAGQTPAPPSWPPPKGPT